MSVLSSKYFHDEKAAYNHLESVLWPDGPTCPHCGNADVKRITRLEGKATRMGVHKCNECRKQFTVKVGTVFESAHLPLHKMLQAVYLITCSKKSISAHQLHRILQITYKSAWFLAHRVREALRTGGRAPMGGPGSIVEVDETYFGESDDQPTKRTDGKPFRKKGRHGPSGKRAVLALVERGGEVRSFHIDKANIATVSRIVFGNVAFESALSTDESKLYPALAEEYASHKTVRHAAGQYVKDDAHTNTVEGVFSIFKRGMKGVYQHCSEKHLHRYLAEFDFRYNARAAVGINDEARSVKALKGISGKRLTYRAADRNALA